MGIIKERGGGSTGHLSKETKKKISKSRKGKCCGKRPPDVGKRISQSKIGHEVGEDTRKRISENLKGRFVGSKNGNSKPIICLDTGEYFECARDACKIYGISPSNMSSHLKGKKKSVNKLHFKYAFTNND